MGQWDCYNDEGTLTGVAEFDGTNMIIREGYCLIFGFADFGDGHFNCLASLGYHFEHDFLLIDYGIDYPSEPYCAQMGAAPGVKRGTALFGFVEHDIDHLKMHQTTDVHFWTLKKHQTPK